MSTPAHLLERVHASLGHVLVMTAAYASGQRMTSSPGKTGAGHRVWASPMRREKRSPGGGGASPAASINRAANGAPLGGGRFVRATAVRRRQHLIAIAVGLCDMPSRAAGRRSIVRRRQQRLGDGPAAHRAAEVWREGLAAPDVTGHRLAAQRDRRRTWLVIGVRVILDERHDDMGHVVFPLVGGGRRVGIPAVRFGFLVSAVDGLLARDAEGGKPMAILGLRRDLPAPRKDLLDLA
jgi:hypothetical protein